MKEYIVSEADLKMFLFYHHYFCTIQSQYNFDIDNNYDEEIHFPTVDLYINKRTIPKDRVLREDVIGERDYRALLRDYYILTALREGGVEKWDKYKESLQNFLDKHHDKDFDSFVDEIMRRIKTGWCSKYEDG